MPTIVTRGVASARGAGTFSAAPPPPPTPPPPGPTPPPPPPPSTLQTVTFFNSGGSWTAPAGVTNLTLLDIKGGTSGQTAGQFLYTTGNFNFAFYSLIGTAQPGSQAAAYTYAQVGAIADSVLAQLNAGGPFERDVSFSQVYNNYNPNTGGFYDQPTGYARRIRGTAVPASGPWDNRSNAIVQGIGNGWYFGVEVYYPPEPVEGGPSSAFGYTAQGGAPPQEILESNVPVVPGQTYTIQVSPSSGLVQFQFIQE